MQRKGDVRYGIWYYNSDSRLVRGATARSSTKVMIRYYLREEGLGYA
jgi:hypothetical protein